MAMLQYQFIQRALIAGVALSFITPILGLLLILRRQSLLSDTLSHVSLVGVALGLLLKFNLTVSTIIVVVIASMLLESMRRMYRNFSEVSIAVMMSGGMALALVLLSLSTSASSVQIDKYLFGTILLITQQEVYLLIGLAVIVVILYAIYHRILYVMSFNEDTAHTSGLPVQFISMAISVINGIVISLMMPIVGALLVSALVVIPAATSISISKSFNQAIGIGIVINLIGIIGGIISSFYFDTPPGATITLFFIVIFVVTSLIKNQFTD
ncbi:metal ABC transporter permease [Falseniella ignava]|nr:metal ABC transporter permease [Falseniella ignava]PKY89648.1 metal ABC transporter permease [Falseniella ignava]